MEEVLPELQRLVRQARLHQTIELDKNQWINFLGEIEEIKTIALSATVTNEITNNYTTIEEVETKTIEQQLEEQQDLIDKLILLLVETGIDINDEDLINRLNLIQ